MMEFDFFFPDSLGILSLAFNAFHFRAFGMSCCMIAYFRYHMTFLRSVHLNLILLVFSFSLEFSWSIFRLLILGFLIHRLLSLCQF